jgi:hypothetical protein
LQPCFLSLSLLHSRLVVCLFICFFFIIIIFFFFFFCSLSLSLCLNFSDLT